LCDNFATLNKLSLQEQVK